MLVVVVCTRSLRRVVPGGRRRSGAGRVITSPSSSLAVSRPAADERRPESVAPETSPSEAAVAPAGPRGPAKGGEAVSEGLEAVAEVGLRGHGFLGWGVGERKVRLSQRVAELFFFPRFVIAAQNTLFQTNLLRLSTHSKEQRRLRALLRGPSSPEKGGSSPSAFLCQARDDSSRRRERACKKRRERARHSND